MTPDYFNFLHRAAAPHQSLHLYRSRELHSLSKIGIDRDIWQEADQELASFFGMYLGWTLISLGRGQKFRTETDVGPIQGGLINFKTNPSVFQDQIDHAALLQKGRLLSDQKNACMA